MKPIVLIKASGEQEMFSEKKFQESLKRTGASEETIEELLKTIEPKLHDGMTTHQLYQITRKYLKQTKKTGLIGRYHLKKAILELGPSGFPFEQFIGKLLEKQGYNVEVGKVLIGKCCNYHETDVLAIRDKEHILVECKFHQRAGLKTTVKTALYVKARFDDIIEKHNQKPHLAPVHSCWLVTNTRFTDQATEYGECRSMFMLAWSYPHGKGLKDLIDFEGLHPITCLSSLTKAKKELLLGAGVVLCSELKDHINLMNRIQLSQKEIEAVLKESRAICAGK